MKRSLKFSRTKPIRRPDYFISPATILNKNHGFTPSYEKEKPHINFLLSNEYGRKWFDQHKEYEVELLIMKSEGKVDPSIKRRIICRNLNFNGKTEKKLPIISPKEEALKFYPAKPIRRPDNIISSLFVSLNDKGFSPSYERDKPSMNLLMSDEYRKRWFIERDEYAIEMAVKKNEGVVDTSLKRRILHRNYNFKAGTKKSMPIIYPKEFKHLYHPKVEPRKEVVKYKISCDKIKLSSTNEQIEKTKKHNEKPYKNIDTSHLLKNGIQDEPQINISRVHNVRFKESMKSDEHDRQCLNGDVESVTNAQYPKKMCRCCFSTKNGIQDDVTAPPKLCVCKLRFTGRSIE